MLHPDVDAVCAVREVEVACDVNRLLVRRVVVLRVSRAAVYPDVHRYPVLLGVLGCLQRLKTGRQRLGSVIRQHDDAQIDWVAVRVELDVRQTIGVDDSRLQESVGTVVADHQLPSAVLNRADQPSQNVGSSAAQTGTCQTVSGER